jgi:nitrous oxide reductase
MQKIIIIIATTLVLGAGYMFLNTDNTTTETNISGDTVQNIPAPEIKTNITPATEIKSNVKEFKMTSWMDNIDGKMAAHFSLKEIRVKKGDKVRIIITNTAGNHDFVLDEYKLNLETPLNKPVIVEFTADKVGTFEYYCSKYNHRAIGQKGNLIVE